MGAAAGTWEAVTFGSPFSAPPVVIATPGPSPGGQPFTIRVQNITTTGFEAQVLEPQGSNGIGHYYVEMTYLAIEEGTHGLPDGSLLVAGTSQVQEEQYASNHGLTSTWQNVPLGLRFPNPPTVLAQIQTMNNETGAVPATFSTPFLTVAIDQVVVNSFSVALERSQVVPGSVTVPETVGWVAISPDASGSLLDTSGNTVLWESLLHAIQVDGLQTDPDVTDLLSLPRGISKHAIAHNCIKSRKVSPYAGGTTGFPLAAYFVPGCDGAGAWPDSRIVPAAAPSGPGPGPGPGPT